MPANILIVDDSPVERLLMEGLLTRDPDFHVELAENGKQALDKIAASPPDLVLTDLVMPEMGGLELVRTIRSHWPEIPVILMTAFSDESTATEALEAGAASYVPKALKAERLIDTVRRVVEHAAIDRQQQRLEQCLLEYHCRFALDNDPQLVRTLVQHVQQVMSGIGFAGTVERIRMGEALEEALLSAMYHGNLEISEQELARVRAELDDRLIQRLIEERCHEARIGRRKILVEVHVTTDGARFAVRDQGRGMQAMFAAACDTQSRFETGSRRGLTLLHSVMDEVSYNDAAHELTMTKRKAAFGEKRPAHQGADVRSK